MNMMSRSSVTGPVIATAVLCAALFILYEFTAPQSTFRTFFGLPQTTITRDLELTYDLTEKGDFLATQESAQKILQTTGTSSVAGQRAITATVVADFWGGDMQKQLEAVRLTKEQLLTYPGSPYNQALLINRLLGYITTAMEPQLIDEIFKGEPYGELRIPGDDVGSLKNLAEYSLSKYPTSVAYFKVGIWHATSIFKHFDGIEKLSTSNLDRHIRSIEKILDDTNILFPEEEKRILGRPYWEVQAPAFYYFQGFLNASIALVRHENLPKAEAAFQKVFDYYQERRTADEQGNIMIEARLVYTDFSLATFIYAIDGDARLPEVRGHLDRMIERMEAHPNVHKNSFFAFMRETMLAGPTGTQGRWYSYDRFSQMSALHPPFRDFLNSNGWSLSGLSSTMRYAFF